MSRLLSRLAIAVLAAAAAFPAAAADYPDYGTLRPAFPDDWQPIAEPEPLGFEFGLRYWYSWGEDDWSPNGASHTTDDRTQFLEGHLRIDDYSTNSYVKGLAGYSVVINGDYTNPNPPGSGDLGSGGIGYAGADFGWSPFGGAVDGSGIYGLVGYQYWGEAADPNHIDIHALRLGISARAVMDDMFDVSAEVAAVPYAWVNGTLATDTAAEAVIDTSAYGVMGELMLGIHPAPNFVARVGGRAWYLQGVSDGDNDFSLLRYGLLGELTYKF